jgi:hypothetical protein
MYAAEAYGTLYQFEDLPDSVVFNEIIYPKLGAPIPISGGDGAFIAYRGIESEIEIQLTYSGGQPSFWEFFDGAGGGGAACLIGQVSSDEFANTYTISGPISGNVTRTELCSWRGSGITLVFDGFFEFPDPSVGSQKWKVNGNEKSGFQSTPVGSYAGGYTVS